MRIIIAGAGDVGFHLAKLLVSEGQNIVLIDKDQKILKQTSSQLDVVAVRGSSTSFIVLEEAGISEADLLIAVTSSEEVNLTTCIIGKHLGAKKTISRIQNLEFLINKKKLDLETLGIDEFISPESLAAKEIGRLLKEVAITDIFEFDGGKLSLIGVCVDQNSPLIGKTMTQMSEINTDKNFLTVAILRDNKTIIPHGENQFKNGDHAYFIAQPNGIETVISFSGIPKKNIKNIMILGGSKVGIHAAQRLSGKFNVKLIEKDRDKCFELADQMKDVMVINGDGRDMDLLEEENISDMDAFIAVTGNSETNIISSLVAKNKLVNKTISLIENVDYIQISQNIGVDTMINKKLIAANFIFRYIRKGNIISLTSIHGVDAEVLEFVVKEDSKITKKQIKDLKFPISAIIGGVIREKEGFTTMGNFQFQPQDRAVVLCKPDCIKTVEEFFR